MSGLGHGLKSLGLGCLGLSIGPPDLSLGLEGLFCVKIVVLQKQNVVIHVCRS